MFMLFFFIYIYIVLMWKIVGVSKVSVLYIYIYIYRLRFISRDYPVIFYQKRQKTLFFCYYYVCLPWLLWNSSACRKHTPDRRCIVCVQTSPGWAWAAAGLVSTPLPSILRPITAESSPAQCTIYKKGPYKLFCVPSIILH